MNRIVEAFTELILASIDEGQQQGEGEGLNSLVRFLLNSEDNWDEELAAEVAAIASPPQVAKLVAGNLQAYIADAIYTALEEHRAPKPAPQDVSDLEI